MKNFLLFFLKYGSADILRFFGSLERLRRSRQSAFSFRAPPAAARGRKQVRAIFNIHRQLEIRKLEEVASLRSAANLYSFLGENEKDLSIRAKEIFS